jgi:hypothetical protein
MNRRLFFGVVGCFAGLLPFGAKSIPPIGGNVRLISYVDAKLVGSTFRVLSPIQKPRKANEHYRNGEQLYRVVGHGRHLDVYADEIVAI